MLFYENFIMGFGVLIIGIIVGILFFKFFVIILFNLINFDSIGGFVFFWVVVI